MSEYYSYFDTPIDIYSIQSEIKSIINSDKTNTYISPSEPPGLSNKPKQYFQFELSKSHFEPLIGSYENINNNEDNNNSDRNMRTSSTNCKKQ